MNKQPTCRSCKVRFEAGIPEVKDIGDKWKVHPMAFKWIENAARFFDQESGDERFTAADFIAWIRPEVVTRSVKHGP